MGLRAEEEEEEEEERDADAEDVIDDTVGRRCFGRGDAIALVAEPPLWEGPNPLMEGFAAEKKEGLAMAKATASLGCASRFFLGVAFSETPARVVVTRDATFFLPAAVWRPRPGDAAAAASCAERRSDEAPASRRRLAELQAGEDEDEDV